MSYTGIHNKLVSETGFMGAFYRGLWPWGVMQCVKGLPVLFVNSEVKYLLLNKTDIKQR